MIAEQTSSIHICFAPPFVDTVPDDIDVGYRIIVPYPQIERERLGKVECDCKEVVKMYRPYIGVSLHHSGGCAIRKHLFRYPGILNFVEWSDCIAHSV